MTKTTFFLYFPLIETVIQPIHSHRIAIEVFKREGFEVLAFKVLGDFPSYSQAMQIRKDQKAVGRSTEFDQEINFIEELI